jgi:hypothetical protein
MTDAPTTDGGDAARIYQAHLDACTSALWERDFAAVAAMSVYPHRMGTADSVVEVTDAEARVAFLRAFYDALQDLRATAYIQICRSAAFAGPERIDGTYKTYALRGGTPVIAPYEVEMPLHLRGGDWLGGDRFAAVGDSDGRIIQPLIGTERELGAGGLPRAPSRI